MIRDIALFQWFKLFVAGILFIGPGYALLSFVPFKDRFNKTDQMLLSFAFSVGFWAVLLAWLQWTGASLNAAWTLAIFLIGWGVGLVRNRPWKIGCSLIGQLFGDLNQISLWVALSISLMVGLYSIRHVVVGLGSDSYHHTLITQMLVDQGKIPTNYLPYAPIITFSYHYGFHALAAAIVWLTGIPTRLVVPILGQILVPLSGLSVAFFAFQVIGKRIAGTIGAAITALAAVFPFYMLNWGRDTQILGLTLLPVFLGLVWLWRKEDFRSSFIPWLALSAAGISLAHYRVTLMAILAVMLLFFLELVYYPTELKQIGVRLREWAMVASGVLFLVGPWMLHVYLSHRQGYPVNIGTVDGSFFSITRLGQPALDYPTNFVLLTLACIALISGWILHDRFIIWLTLWTAIMLLLSRPPFAGQFMDTVSVLISLYIPLAVAVGWLFAKVLEHVPTSGVWLKAAILALSSAYLLWSATNIPKYIDPAGAYVTREDLAAADWIRANTPPNAYFMVNTINFSFSPKFIIGPDAGYWLPLLAGRRTVTLPMTFQIERFSQPNVLDQLVNLHHLAGYLTTSDALNLMRADGIYYIFLGQKGGMISAEQLSGSADYKMVYHQSATYVFKIK
jgi:hypothetical protein